MKDLFFQQGDRVEAAEIILQLNDDIERARLGQIDARLLTQESKILSSEAALAQSRIRLLNAEKTYKRFKTLLEQNAEAQAGYDQAKTDYDALMEEARRLEADTKTAKNLIREFKADRRLILIEMEKKKVKAPADGQLLSLEITAGFLLSPESPIGLFAPDGPKVARGEVDELFAADVRVGMKAYIRPQGDTEKLADGAVVFVGPFLRKKSLFSDDVGDLEDRRVREIWIELDSSESLLLGARVECVILLK